jgi:hypothetical protein
MTKLPLIGVTIYFLLVRSSKWINKIHIGAWEEPAQRCILTYHLSVSQNELTRRRRLPCWDSARGCVVHLEFLP